MNISDSQYLEAYANFVLDNHLNADYWDSWIDKTFAIKYPQKYITNCIEDTKWSIRKGHDTMERIQRLFDNPERWLRFLFPAILKSTEKTLTFPKINAQSKSVNYRHPKGRGLCDVPSVGRFDLHTFGALTRACPESKFPREKGSFERRAMLHAALMSAS
jgi:hypothetical protein